MRRITILAVAALVAAALAQPGAAAPGGLDPRFSGDGKVRFDFPGASEPWPAVAVQRNGRILLAGYTSDGTDADSSVARFRPNGTRDIGFGTGGLATVDFPSTDDFPTDIAIQRDGKIVVVGDAYSTDYDIMAVRFKPDGSVDTGFGTNRRIRKGFGPDVTDHAKAVLIQPDGKIVIAGETSPGDDQEFLVLRYRKSGQRDLAFGTGGSNHIDFPTTGNSFVNDALLQPSGKIVLGGQTFKESPLNGNFALARFNGNGTHDLTFGETGYAMTDLGSDTDEIYGIDLQRSGRIVAGGYANNSDPVFALARYTRNGDLNGSFGSG